MTSLTTRRPLGTDGPLVASFALGTMTFGVETDEADAHAQLDRFVAAGGNLIDTADVYGAGASEAIIGRWLAAHGRREDVVIATKGRFDPAPGSGGASRVSLERAIDGSLERLGIDTIDLYFVHGWDPHTPVEETLETLTGFVERGSVRAIGWSNTTGWQLQRILAAARHHGYAGPTVFQPQYNLLDRAIEWEVMPCCLEGNLAMTPWSPLGGGWLTGKYQRDITPTGSTRLGDDPGRGVEAYDGRNTDRTWRILDVVREVAHAHERPMAHVALAWVADRPGVASVLLGARTPAQLDDNLAASDLALEDDEVAALTEVSAPGVPPYPYGMVQDYCDVTMWQDLGTG